MARQRLIELRAGRPAEKVAKGIGISRQMLNFIESGERTPSLAVAKRIADYYHVSVDEIFFAEDCNEMRQVK